MLSCTALVLKDPRKGTSKQSKCYIKSHNQDISIILISTPSEQIIRHQDNLEKQYTALRDRADERRQKLDNHYHMYQLKREVEDLEQWIAERDIKASSQEMGQDLDHVTVSILYICPMEGSVIF